MGIRAWTLGLSFAALALAFSSSCVTRSDCDRVVRRCRPVCDVACDFFSCYPVCFDRCFDECRQEPAPVATSVPPAPSAPPGDAGAPLPASDAGRGVLCSACAENEDCQAGALCIERGGDAGTAFCSLACASSADCPEGFTCAQVGAARQCLPLGGACP